MTSYFCLARKLIWPLWSSHIFTQWGWLILFSPKHFHRQHKNSKSPPNYLFLFLRTFWEGWMYFLSAPCIAAGSQHHEESRLIYGPLEFTLLDQRFSVEHELDAWNPPHTVSSHSCWMYVRAGRPAFARPYVGVHRSTSLMSSSLLLQQCPACLVCLIWIVFVIGGRWPYSWCLVGCCRKDLFKIAHSIILITYTKLFVFK